MANILIVDDDPVIQDLLAAHVEKSKNSPTIAGTLNKAFQLAETIAFDLVFLDVRLPDGNGLVSLPKFKNLPCQPEVIIITAVGDDESAEKAIKSGAWSYIQKPATHDEISLQIMRALQYRERQPEDRAISLKRENIVGSSQQITAALDIVAQAARSEANILLTGETGTGKELFAKTIHQNSRRAEKPYVIVDCTALPETLIESILFGHKKGAFTGADNDKVGLITRADKGTLFLDEIGELPLETQKSFLRVLQERCFRPLGSHVEMKSDFRLISATNRNLEKMVEQGEFRSDLLFRIKTFSIDLPPLRDRTEDIKEMAQHFIMMICERHRLHVKGFTADCMEILESYNWPGNVRELYHTLEKAILTDSLNATLFPAHLPQELRIYHAQREMRMKQKTEKDGISNGELNSDAKPVGTFDFGALSSDNMIPPLKRYRQKIVEEVERQYLTNLLDHVGHNIKKAIEISGVGQARFYALLKKYHLSKK